MNQVQHFQVGDRISTKYPLDGLPAGSCGTVRSVFVSATGVYEVLFDPAQTWRIAFQSELNLIPPAR
jgi:hypothetical protein